MCFDYRWNVNPSLLALALPLGTQALLAQSRQVQGLVTGEAGTPLVQAAIWVKNTTQGTYTGEDGRFSLQVPGPEFHFSSNRHQYYHNGLTVDPAAGFEALPFTSATDVTYSLSPGTGFQGTTQIFLTDESFIGVKNAGPVYDIIELTADRMVLLSAQTDGAGWFTQIFIRE